MTELDKNKTVTLEELLLSTLARADAVTKLLIERPILEALAILEGAVLECKKRNMSSSALIAIPALCCLRPVKHEDYRIAQNVNSSIGQIGRLLVVVHQVHRVRW